MQSTCRSDNEIKLHQNSIYGLRTRVVCIQHRFLILTFDTFPRNPTWQRPAGTWIMVFIFARLNFVWVGRFEVRVDKTNNERNTAGICRRRNCSETTPTRYCIKLLRHEVRRGKNRTLDTKARKKQIRMIRVTVPCGNLLSRKGNYGNKKLGA